MKKILYPTDFSETSQNAFIFALQIADHLGASIITIHAFDKPDISNFNLPDTLRDVYDSIDLNAFENYEDELPVLRDIAIDNGYYHVPMVHVLEEGAAVSAILRTANKNKVDLIVMGNTGAGMMEKFFFGTVSGKVLEEAHCPVILVPVTAQFDGMIDNIAIATNMADEDVIFVDEVRKFRELMGCHIHLVHINTTQNVDENPMKAFCERWNSDKKITSHVVNHSDINEGLESFVSENKIDLLALLSHKRNWFEDLFSKTRAKNISFHQTIPLLVYQSENLIP